MIATSGGPAIQNSHPGDSHAHPTAVQVVLWPGYKADPLHREGACACVPCPVFTQQEIGLQKSGKWVGSVPERHPTEPCWQSIM